MDLPALQPRLFTDPGSIGRFGTPPFRIEVMNAIDGLPIPVIGLTDLTTNKTAAGRHKDLADLENLPQGSQGPEPAWRTSSTLERAHAHDLGLGP